MWPSEDCSKLWNLICNKTLGTPARQLFKMTHLPSSPSPLIQCFHHDQHWSGEGGGGTKVVCFHSIPKLSLSTILYSEACFCAQFQQVSQDVLTMVVAPSSSLTSKTRRSELGQGYTSSKSILTNVLVF